MHIKDVIDRATSLGHEMTTGQIKISTEKKKSRKLLAKASLRILKIIEMLKKPRKTCEKKRANGSVSASSEDEGGMIDENPKRQRVSENPFRLRISSLNCVQQMIRKYTEEEKKKSENFMRTNFQDYLSRFLCRKTNVELSGRERLNLIEKLIRTFLSQGIWKMQMRFINACNQVNLKNILGKDYEKEASKICDERGWDIKIATLINVLAPRRGGKTTVAAAVFAAYLIAIPEFFVLNTAGGKNMANEFVHIVGRFLSKLTYLVGRLTVNKSEIYLKSEFEGLVSRLKSFACQGTTAIAV
jgi:hypothetical protein